MDKKIEKSVLKTLVYSDIFDYPLSKDELWKFLIGKKIDKKIFLNFLKDLPKKVFFKKNLYYLYGRENIVRIRITREKDSEKKLALAKKIVKKLSFIPTVQFIGISGALSLKNSDKIDDIDLFVITSNGSLWVTRLIMIIFLLLTGRYRRRNQKEVSDKICLNMLITDSALCFTRIRQNLYTAHEIAQLLPVFERNGAYNKFMSANEWVEKYLPNALGRIKNQESRIKNRQKKPLFIIHDFLFILEGIAKAVQIWLIKKHLTIETISDNFLAFHPKDYKDKVLNEYKKGLRVYEV